MKRLIKKADLDKDYEKSLNDWIKEDILILKDPKFGIMTEAGMWLNGEAIYDTTTNILYGGLSKEYRMSAGHMRLKRALELNNIDTMSEIHLVIGSSEILIYVQNGEELLIKQILPSLIALNDKLDLLEYSKQRFFYDSITYERTPLNDFIKQELR